MINVNQITSMLAKLPDQSLQQYAEMHKNDPYVMSLAVSESNRRKQMRAGAQAPQQQGEAPSVAEQAIADMAAPMPEDQGIARLPAGDMNFADGGIVAFADGGDIPRYNGSQSQFVKDNPAAMSVLTPLQDAVLTAKRRYEAAVNSRDSQSAQLYLQQLSDAQKRLSAAAQQQFGEGTAAQAMTAAQEASVPAAPAAAQTSAPPIPNAAQNIGSTFTPGGESGLRPESSRIVPATEDTAGKDGLSTKKVDAGKAAPATGLGGLMDAIKPASSADSVGSISDRIKAVAQSKADISKEEAAGLEAIQKQYDNIYKGREERLTKREGELEDLKDKSYKLAMLQAGAAIMGSTGNLGSAIGKGITAGAIAHERGIDKVRDAQSKLDDARDRMEELQANRGEMSAREMLKAKSAIKRDLHSGEEMMLKYIMDKDKVDREEAMKRLELQTRVGIAQFEQSSANARAAMPTGEMRAAMMLGKGDTDAAKLESGLKKMQEITADKTGMAAVKQLAEINAKLLPGEPKVTMAELLASAREFSALMYPPKAASQPTGKVFK